MVHANSPAAGQRSQLSASRAPQAESSAAGVWFYEGRQTKLVCCGFHINFVALPIFTHMESTDLIQITVLPILKLVTQTKWFKITGKFFISWASLLLTLFILDSDPEMFLYNMKKNSNEAYKQLTKTEHLSEHRASLHNLYTPSKCLILKRQPALSSKTSRWWEQIFHKNPDSHLLGMHNCCTNSDLRLCSSLRANSSSCWMLRSRASHSSFWAWSVASCSALCCSKAVRRFSNSNLWR